MKHIGRWTPYLFVIPALAGLVLFRVVPIIISIIGSFTEQTILGNTKFAGLSNYIELINTPAFWASLRTTVYFNLLINPIQVILAFLLALLVFENLKGIGFFRTMFFIPYTTSIVVASILWMLLLDPSLGMVNGFLKALNIEPQPFFRDPSQALYSIMWLASWKGVGYWMMFLLAGLNDIPRLLYEAAEIDGASPIEKLFHITLPLMKRPIAFVTLYATIANFLLFAPVYIVTKGGPIDTTSLLMYRAYQDAFVYRNLGRSLATSAFLLVIILIFAFIELRLLRSEDDSYV